MAVSFDFLLGDPERRQAILRFNKSAFRGLMLTIEPNFPLIEAGNLRLQSMEVGGCLVGT